MSQILAANARPHELRVRWTIGAQQCAELPLHRSASAPVGGGLSESVRRVSNQGPTACPNHTSSGPRDDLDQTEIAVVALWQPRVGMEIPLERLGGLSAAARDRVDDSEDGNCGERALCAGSRRLHPASSESQQKKTAAPSLRVRDIRAGKGPLSISPAFNPPISQSSCFHLLFNPPRGGIFRSGLCNAVPGVAAGEWREMRDTVDGSDHRMIFLDAPRIVACLHAEFWGESSGPGRGLWCGVR